MKEYYVIAYWQDFQHEWALYTGALEEDIQVVNAQMFILSKKNAAFKHLQVVKIVLPDLNAPGIEVAGVAPLTN